MDLSLRAGKWTTTPAFAEAPCLAGLDSRAMTGLPGLLMVILPGVSTGTWATAALRGPAVFMRWPPLLCGLHTRRVAMRPRFDRVGRMLLLNGHRTSHQTLDQLQT